MYAHKEYTYKSISKARNKVASIKKKYGYRPKIYHMYDKRSKRFIVIVPYNLERIDNL